MAAELGNFGGIEPPQQPLLSLPMRERRGFSEVSVKTSDDRTYQILGDSIRKVSGDVDLAIVKFRSSTSYPLARLGNSNLLRSGTEIYVAGFPSPTRVITQSIFVLRPGQVSANSSVDLAEGYSLLYSNSTLPGMSGGPILNTDGEVVGIHGKGDRDERTGEKTEFNSGMTIAKFAEVAQSVGVTLDSRVARVQRSNTLSAEDFFAAGNQKYDAGNFPGALADYDRAVALSPNYAFAYNNRGNVKRNLNDNRAIVANPNFAHAYYNRALIKKDFLDDRPGAIADFRAAARLHRQAGNTAMSQQATDQLRNLGANSD